jgi:hypothetical protein
LAADAKRDAKIITRRLPGYSAKPKLKADEFTELRSQQAYRQVRLRPKTCGGMYEKNSCTDAQRRSDATAQNDKHRPAE